VPLAQVLADFGGSVAQCDSLIANAHGLDATGASLLPVLDQRQITIAAFLNCYIAWETFLEASLAEFMVGSPTLSGTPPVKYVSPVTHSAARALVIGVNRYFDYGNHENVKRIVNLYFENGYPYEPHLSSINAELAELRTMRNASAHITSTTQTALEGLALSIFGTPSIGVDLYTLLTSTDPRSPTGETVYLAYKTKLLIAAGLITQG
jgi:hypothetical protein